MSGVLEVDMQKIIAVLVVMVLSAWAVHTPSGSIIVDPDRKHDRGGFCPPGQAKKGNC